MNAIILLLLIIFLKFIQYIRKAFRNVEKSIEVSFQFKDDDDGFIELCFDDEKCPKGWSVRPHQDPTRVSIEY